MTTYTVYLCLLAMIIYDVLSCQHSNLTITSHLHPETPVFVSFYIHIMTPPPPSHNKHNNRFTALFLGPPGWAGARRELLDFMVQGQGKINRGRHTNHPAGRHSIQTNQCPPPPSPICHIMTDYVKTETPHCCIKPNLNELTKYDTHIIHSVSFTMWTDTDFWQYGISYLNQSINLFPDHIS